MAASYINQTDLITATWAPGAATTHTLPTYFPDIGELVGAVLESVAHATVITTTTLVVAEFGATAIAGEIAVTDGNTLTTGTITVVDELLVITYRAA